MAEASGQDGHGIYLLRHKDLNGFLGGRLSSVYISLGDIENGKNVPEKLISEAPIVTDVIAEAFASAPTWLWVHCYRYAKAGYGILWQPCLMDIQPFHAIGLGFIRT